ncbi:Crp/Fnr family transcriptional regulator [Pleurocapsa sp. PCC 7319]|uniref:Crp/Fnr family transcriptional regulator n=1 Tax=Pleurocapsa sp. PCC 7319 TaxID=118161 RepID=UPI0003473179|nr:Crp/Fnr family transcriptional regulator [Pleurocapsa sp. PCC 7319]
MNLSVPNSLPSPLPDCASYQNLVAGQVLFHHRDSAEYIFALEVGRIQLVRYTCDGNMVVFQIVRATESFAESALFTELYHCNAIVEVPSRVIRYPKTIVGEVLQNNPDLALNFLRRQDRKSQSLKKLLELRSIRSARDRILQYLLFSAYPGETRVVFDRTYKDIATELGLSSETLYRNLSELERLGFIARRGREIELSIPET